MPTAHTVTTNTTVASGTSAGEISDLCRWHGTKRWAVVNVPSGVAWAVKSNSVGASTNITLIVGAP